LPLVGFGEGFEAGEALAAEAADVGGDQVLCRGATEGAEGEGEADFVLEFGDGCSGDGVGGFVEVVVVLEEGEAAALLGVLEEGFLGDLVVVDAEEVGVGWNEFGDEGVVGRPNFQPRQTTRLLAVM